MISAILSGVTSSQWWHPAGRRTSCHPRSRSRTCPTGGGARSAAEGEAADEAEMDVDHQIAVESEEDVLASRLGGDCITCPSRAAAPSEEAPLRAAHPQRVTGEGVVEIRGEPIESVTLRHRTTQVGVLDVPSRPSGVGAIAAARLVVGEQRDPSDVPLALGERGRRGTPPRSRSPPRMCACDRRSRRRWRRCAAAPAGRSPSTRPAPPGSFDLVGGHLLSVAGAADHDPQAARVGHDSLRRRDAVRRVVVTVVIGRRAVVDRLVAVVPQPLDEVAA